MFVAGSMYHASSEQDPRNFGPCLTLANAILRQVSHSLHLELLAPVQWLYVPEQIYAAIRTEHFQSASLSLRLYKGQDTGFILRSMRRLKKLVSPSVQVKPRYHDVSWDWLEEQCSSRTES